MKVLHLDIEGGQGGSSRSLRYLVQGLKKFRVDSEVWHAKSGPSILANKKNNIRCSINKNIVSIIPLKRNNDNLVSLAHSVKSSLQKYQIGRVVVENTGNIGKSYRKHDEIGTPLCITIDFDSLDNNTITIRDRDSMRQTTISIDNVQQYFLDYYSDESA